ncbi:MAG: peptide chain release factor N(5)-glutamine methyltransferase [Deltaproteobacteria bacterium]|nr:peptide chain release factor N(5)-glutamine methyltransferase [Deltaproteobacteria bacterium]
MTWPLLELVHKTTQYFEQKNIPSPRASSEILMALVLECRRVDLYVRYNDILSDDVVNRFREFVKRRAQGEPIAYITGHREFWSLDFEVGRGVLIPRPETEIVIEDIQKNFSKENCFSCFEWGAGSGAVSIALASHFSQAHFVASEISKEAYKYAKKNIEKHKVAVDLREGDGFSVIKDSEKFELFVSNPPYVSEEQFENLPLEVKNFEPHLALVGGKKGVKFHLEIINQVKQYLKPGAFVYLELDPSQGDLLKSAFLDQGTFRDVCVLPDYSGRDRIMRVLYG